METETQKFDTLLNLMRRLRAPGGCPWDAEQTHESLKRYLLEETYEVLEAIDAKSTKMLKEELGDLLLQAVFHTVIAEEKGEFTMDEVLQVLCDKLIRRHPHVFTDLEIDTIDDLVANWERIKKAEKGEERRSVLSGVPPQLPALLRAQKITEKASRVGFDWDHVDPVFAKVLEELKELEETLFTGDQERIEAELGDLLFSIVNLGRFLSINPEDALRKTISRFISRFNHVEESLHSQGKSLTEASLEQMDRLWDEAKKAERNK
ncbi:MAG: nucleoside triphosphate pyrophosphohydrolase [Deltaproteobacteria bacterium]|nr:nucleoside triphosphate pyrophosphohydrolase [Deltaproteobacteria bacterium]